MIFNEIKCHVNAPLGLVGGCIPCIPLCVRACMCPECPRKEWRDNPSGNSLHPQESGQEVVQVAGYVTTSPTSLDPVLVWSQQNYLRLLLIVRYFGSSERCCPPKGKAGTKISE